ncbi:unnamed protein product, partial [Chrysoparadoxa australica]
LRWLAKKKLLQPNKTQFTHPDGTTMCYSKPHIFEADLHDEVLRAKVPALSELFTSTSPQPSPLPLPPALVEAFQCLLGGETTLCTGSKGMTVKLQMNEGEGGCFPYHYDNPGPPNRRRLTCLLYLNPDWEEGHGGEMILHPFLQSPVTVAPLMNRLVVFASDRILHRVAPCHHERYAITFWIDSMGTNQEEDLTLRVGKGELSDWLGWCERLRYSPCQRILSRGIYQEEYNDSLQQCMAGAAGSCQEMIAAHQEQISKLQKNAPLYALVKRLRDTKELNESMP